MKVKAVVLRQMGQPAPYPLSQPLVTETVELAPPGPGELCVHVLAAGLCHSDLSDIDGTRPRPMPKVWTTNCGRCGPCASGSGLLISGYDSGGSMLR